MSAWIDVKEKLPKKDAPHGVSVPVLVRDGGYRKVAFIGNDDKWYLNGVFKRLEAVTHWMPLPEATVTA